MLRGHLRDHLFQFGSDFFHGAAILSYFLFDSRRPAQGGDYVLF
nr:MAG TPA: hypothetical protein [Caudoviricetes sp.]